MIQEKIGRSPLIAQPSLAASVVGSSESAHPQLLLRILSSRTFARSERLSTLLKYVCELTFKGRGTDLNEQRIGQAVFGRSPDYDSSADGIVRTQASRLRQRLDLYFDEEGMNEPIRLMIPKGGYVPVFVPRPTAEETVFAAASPVATFTANLPQGSYVMPPEPTGGWGVGTPVRQLVPWMLCAFLTVVLAVVLLRHHEVVSAGAAAPPHPLWSQLFLPQHATLEVPGDSGLVMFHRFTEEQVSLNEYLVGNFRAGPVNSTDPGASFEMQNLRTDISNRRYTSIVDLDAAVTLAQIAQARHSNLQIRYARDLRPNDLKNGNIILVGAFEANPWIELFERRMNFTLEDNFRTHVFTVVNKSPHAGEPGHWDSVASDPQRAVYGIVAFMPNISGNGNALLIEGTGMSGTEAAWDFVSNDTELLPFLRTIQHADGRVPHFELLLRTQNMGASAVHGNLIAWRLVD